MVPRVQRTFTHVRATTDVARMLWAVGIDSPTEVE